MSEHRMRAEMLARIIRMHERAAQFWTNEGQAAWLAGDMQSWTVAVNNIAVHRQAADRNQRVLSALTAEIERATHEAGRGFWMALKLHNSAVKYSAALGVPMTYYHELLRQAAEAYTNA